MRWRREWPAGIRTDRNPSRNVTWSDTEPIDHTTLGAGMIINAPNRTHPPPSGLTSGPLNSRETRRQRRSPTPGHFCVSTDAATVRCLHVRLHGARIRHSCDCTAPSLNPGAFGAITVGSVHPRARGGGYPTRQHCWFSPVDPRPLGRWVFHRHVTTKSVGSVPRGRGRWQVPAVPSLLGPGSPPWAGEMLSAVQIRA